MDRLGQIVTPQQITLIALPFLPLQGPPRQPGVPFHPVEVGLHSPNQLFYGPLKIVRFTKEYPVERSQRGRHLFDLGLAINDRDQPFIELLGHLELHHTLHGVQKVGTHHKDNRLSLFDPLVNLGPPVRRLRNILPIHPDILLLLE